MNKYLNKLCISIVLMLSIKSSIAGDFLGAEISDRQFNDYARALPNLKDIRKDQIHKALEDRIIEHNGRTWNLTSTPDRFDSVRTHLTSPSAIVLAGATDLDRRGIDSGFACDYFIIDCENCLKNTVYIGTLSPYTNQKIGGQTFLTIDEQQVFEFLEVLEFKTKLDDEHIHDPVVAAYRLNYTFAQVMEAKMARNSGADLSDENKVILKDSDHKEGIALLRSSKDQDYIREAIKGLIRRICV